MGNTPHTAYYDLMDKTKHWPQAARDALYVMLYAKSIALEHGEDERSLGVYSR